MRWMSRGRVFAKTCFVLSKILRGGSLGNGSHGVESDLGGGAESARTLLMIPRATGRQVLFESPNLRSFSNRS